MRGLVRTTAAQGKRRWWGGLGAATFMFWAFAGTFAQSQPAPSASQGPTRRLTFRATHYEVSAALTTQNHLLEARVRMELVAVTPGRTAEFELHPDLKVNAVLDAERRPLPFDRTDDGKLVLVTLPQAYTNGDKIALTVEYAGPLAENEAQLPGSVRWAYIGNEGSYLLQPARWFPLTDFPSGRYTGTFEIAVTGDVVVAGTGKGAAPQAAEVVNAALAASAPAKAPTKATKVPVQTAPEPLKPIAPAGTVVYRFTVEQPSAAGSFVVGRLMLTPVRAEGLSFPIYLAAGQEALAQPYGESLARIVNFYSSEIGPLHDQNLTVVQLPNLPGVPSTGFSAPGVLFLGARQWTKEVNYRLLAQVAARQWWNGEVLPAGPNDGWLGDGLARFSEALYVEHFASREGFLRVLEDAAVAAMMYEDAAPIAQAVRLDPASAEYRSVVINKGAIVFNMLRGALGEEAFRGLLRDYYSKFRGKSGRLSDFQALVQERAAAQASAPAPAVEPGNTNNSAASAAAAAKVPLNAQAFFGQWLNSTGVPEFKLEYLVVRTQKGFRVVGKVLQDLETFRSAVEMKVETDGNPEYKVIEVMGASSEFSIDTFGRPKPGQIQLDPNNYILKASPKLRVRSAIGRGEALAEEGKYYDAVQQYQAALELQKNSSLAHFRMAEAFFYQKNLQASANAFRDAIDGDRDPKWVEVWSHIYLGKIFDITGQRERAVNEYQKAVDTNDNTGGAQEEAEKLLKEPYKEGT
jgi:tetratricopeptide (TPR) repeat protein